MTTGTDPTAALILFLAALVMVVVVIGGGVWLAVRAGNTNKPH
ncbi:hypothetical protein [Nocardioides sp. T2.26MG-1]|nr:hypothetical protein [Nocardioides sp. T2.26MG-1]CAI9412751.1 hypothetical protein HIDPHFAB_01854 [Nocardioides sp. T2.26MG-1]